jgi:group I intron endonuclease
MLIYCVKNKINGKEYIGLTTRSVDIRWKQHLYESNKVDSWEYKTPLGSAIKKYGKEGFDISTLKHCNSIEDMKQSEREIIETRKSHVSVGGYNVTKGGDGRFGTTWSQEIKDKIGAGNKGKIMSEEAKQKMRVAKQGIYDLGDSNSAVEILVNGTTKFSCIKEFADKYRLKYSSVVSSISRNGGKTTFKDFKIERI